MLPEKTVRNVALYEDYVSGKFTTAQLIVKYNIGQVRINQIVKKEKIKRAFSRRKGTHE